MASISALDLSVPIPSRPPPSPQDSPNTRADSLTDPPSPTTKLPPPVRPAPGPRTVSAPGNPFMVSEAVHRIYLRDRIKRQEFSRRNSYSNPSLGSAGSRSVGSPLRQSSTAASIHSVTSEDAPSNPASSLISSSTRIRWYPERVVLAPSIAESVKEPDSPYDELGLPHNGSEVPLLWNVEEFTCWDIAFRRMVGPLANLLENANLLLTQTGIALAGMYGSDDPEKMRVVVTILLDEHDIDKVLGVGEIQSAVEALVKQRFTETPAIPPVRYWVKEEARMIWEHVKLDGVQTFGGREPKIRKPLKLRDPDAEDEIAAMRRYDQAWRLGLAKKIKDKKEKERLEREEKMAQRAAERQAAAEKGDSEGRSSLQGTDTSQSTIRARARETFRRVLGSRKRKDSRAQMNSQASISLETMPTMETETTSGTKQSVKTKASSVNKKTMGAEKESSVQAVI